MAFRNLARMYSATTGTSDAVMTTAVPGCNTWDLAGVANGEIVRYGIITYSTTTNRPTHSEVGLGTYTAATKTLARTTVESSTNAGAKITLTGLSEVFICPTAADHPNIFSVVSSNYTDATIANTATGTLILSTELTDDFGMVSLASNVATLALAGWYDVQLIATLTVNGGVAVTADGYFMISLANNGASDDTLAHFPLSSGNIVTVRNFMVRGTIELTAGQTVNASLINNTGHSLTAYVQELRFIRLGA